MNHQSRRGSLNNRQALQSLVLCSIGSLAGIILTGCSHSAPKAALTPATPPPIISPPVSAPVPMILTSYPAYRPLSSGQETKSLLLQNTTPGDNSVPAASMPPYSAQSRSPIAQGRVSLDDYQFHITPDNAGGSILDGSVSVHNHGPYDITDFQVSLREGGILYVLIPPGAGHQIGPSQGTVYTIHSAVPLSMEQLKAGKSFLLEAQLDGPPGLATDEESGTTTLSTVPGMPSH